MVKVTFTLDEAHGRAAERDGAAPSKPKSEVVREAIGEYHGKSDKLSEAERQRMLRVLQEYATSTAQRSPRRRSANSGRFEKLAAVVGAGLESNIRDPAGHVGCHREPDW